MTNETTAPERIWFNGGLIESHMHTSRREFAGGVEYVRADTLEAAQARIAELEQHISDMIDDSGQECACGYDNPTDICLGHLPMYRKAQARIAELEGALTEVYEYPSGQPIALGLSEEDWQRRRAEQMRFIARAALEGKG